MSKESVDILMIDNDELTRNLVERRACDSGLSIKAFATPEEFSRYLATHDAKILLIDQRMPKMNGDELLAQLINNQLTGNASSFLCTTILPDQVICNRIEAMGGEIIMKDIVYAKGGLSTLLEQHLAS